MPRRILIDADPGMDDALALALSFVPLKSRRSLMLDAFEGSGSTGVTAKRQGRAFIGYEIEAEIAANAQERVRSTLNV